MASHQTVSLERSFNYVNAAGEERYFVRQNQHEILTFLTPADLEHFAELGYITIATVPDVPVTQADHISES